MGLFSFKKDVANVTLWTSKDWAVFRGSIEEGFREVSGIKKWDLLNYWKQHFFLVDLSTIERDNPPNPKKLGRCFGIMYYLLEHNQNFALNQKIDFKEVIKKLKKVKGLDLTELKQRVSRFDGRTTHYPVEDIVGFQREVLARF